MPRYVFTSQNISYPPTYLDLYRLYILHPLLNNHLLMSRHRLIHAPKPRPIQIKVLRVRILGRLLPRQPLLLDQFLVLRGPERADDVVHHEGGGEGEDPPEVAHAGRSGGDAGAEGADEAYSIDINIWSAIGDEGIDIPGNGSAIAIMYAITAWMFHPP